MVSKAYDSRNRRRGWTGRPHGNLVAPVVHCRRRRRVEKLDDSTDVLTDIGCVHDMEAVNEAAERRQLAEVISRDKELYDVVSRHGLTDHDLLGALRDLRKQGRPLADLWALVSYAARLKAISLAAVGS